MSSQHRFHQVDVFSMTPLCGNPVAVVHDAGDLSDVKMAAFARWTNLSETTFLLPPLNAQADYRLRIFTPRGELPFAGHPTLGSCHSWLATGGVPQSEEFVIQECAIGLVRIRREENKLAFAAPTLRRTGPLDAPLLERISAGLGLAREDILLHQWVDNGPGWCAVMLPSAEQVLAVKPDFTILDDINLGIIGPQPHGSETDYEVRAFVASLGVPEDPVTGSLNAGLAQWLIGDKRAKDSYVVSQGTALNRRGRVFVNKIGSEIWIGGHSTLCIQGQVTL